VRSCRSLIGPGSVGLAARAGLGVGSGEAIREHVLGGAWPEARVRREMLEEAIGVMRALWRGGQYSHRGKYYTVQSARI
jgi:alkanesulfonate monooxygenase SsuD/methylene tetrahydromethanopterin reductase-like flavin-dependent oxidoreductase (luciferase family)